MITAKIGQRYLIIKLKIFFLLNVPSSRRTSSSIFFSPITLEIRRHVANAAIGIITEFVRKSKKSRNCIPMIFTNASGPYPRDERLPRTIIIAPTTNVDFCLTPFQFILKCRHCTFCQGNGTCQGRTEYQNKKQNTYRCSKSHTCKHFWDCNKHQCRTSL